MPARRLITGLRFGRWLVISEETDTSKPHTALCRCDCGTQRSVLAQNMLQGKSQSCGCLRDEIVGKTARQYQKKLKRLKRMQRTSQ